MTYQPFVLIMMAGIFGLSVLLAVRVQTAFKHRQQLWPRLIAATKEESGAAYSISYVMVIPIYAMLMCVIIETSAFLPAKIGTFYSAQAAGRTAAVWGSATDWDNAESKSVAAGKRAFVPFASATQGLSFRAVSIDAGKYVAAHKAFSGNASAKYLLSKYGYTQSALDVAITKPASADDDIDVVVTYQFPFNVPGVARIFGQRRSDGAYVLPITSTVSIASEHPQGVPVNQANPLGIGYGMLE